MQFANNNEYIYIALSDDKLENNLLLLQLQYFFTELSNYM